MTDLRQAAMQALEALEIIDRAMPFPVGKQIITALRKALAQPEQEPVAWRDPTNIDPGQGCTYTKERREKWPHIYRQALYTTPPAAPEQEPVAWLKEDWTGGHLNYESVYEGAFAAFPVYKHPLAAQRPWVGLTDEDWEKVENRKNTVLDTFEQGAVWAAYKLERRNT